MPHSSSHRSAEDVLDAPHHAWPVWHSQHKVRKIAEDADAELNGESTSINTELNGRTLHISYRPSIKDVPFI